MQTRKALSSLKRLVSLINQHGIVSSRDYNPWAKEHVAELAEIFWYERQGSMPPINALMRPFFHPTLPIIGFNYSQVAHITLHRFPNGWTDPLRWCRGIIFDRNGNVLAIPFPKFFNLGEHPETKELPTGPAEATFKHDGHLGIIFPWQDRLIITTRGSFVSRTAAIAQEMLDRYSRENNWDLNLFQDLTPLVEIIHPATHVHSNYDYDQETGFVLIGCMNKQTFVDYRHRALLKIGKALNLPVTKVWHVNDPQEVVRLMKSRTVDGDTEGWVLRGLVRTKIKNLNYLERMLAAKFGKNPHQYVMKRMADHNLERALEALSAEEGALALSIRDEVLAMINGDDELQNKWRKLYTLVPDDQNTSTYQATCRQLVKTLCQ